MDETAEWFDQSLTEFLGDCLQSGIAHAQSKMLEEHKEASGYEGEGAPGEDDLPF